MTSQNKYQHLFFVLVSIVFILTLSVQQLENPRLTTDFVSFALSASAPLFNIGMPYVNYWGINPPGLLAFLGLWGVFFGTSIQSWHILYSLLLVVITFCTHRVFFSIFGFARGAALFIIWSLFFFSSSVQTQFFPSEIQGLALAMAGLVLVIRKPLSFQQGLLATWVFIMAGQMKEVFLLSGLALAPHLFWYARQKRKVWLPGLLALLAGAGLAISSVLSYLLLIGAYKEYLEITVYKSATFNIFDINAIAPRFLEVFQYFKNAFVYTNYQLLILLGLGLISFIIWLNLKIRIVASANSMQKKYTASLTFSASIFSYLAVLCFALGLIIGYAMQGRFGNKYDIAIIFPVIVIVAMVVEIIVKVLLFKTRGLHKKSFYVVVNLVLLGIFLSPQKFFFLDFYAKVRQYSPSRHYHLFWNGEKKDFLQLEEKVRAGTSINDCVTKVYGWGVGDFYYYTQRKSCSHHFLLNILPKQFYSDFVAELIANPPAAIVYTRQATDFNYEQFEREVFDFPRVLESCYQQDEQFEKLYWHKFKDAKLSECLKVGVRE